MKTVEVNEVAAWGTIAGVVLLIGIVILQTARTGELYEKVQDYEKAGTVVWVEGGDILKTEAIDSLTNRIVGLERELN